MKTARPAFARVRRRVWITRKKESANRLPLTCDPKRSFMSGVTFLRIAFSHYRTGNLRTERERLSRSQGLANRTVELRPTVTIGALRLRC
jgi:hypothetical protein